MSDIFNYAIHKYMQKWSGKSQTLSDKWQGPHYVKQGLVQPKSRALNKQYKIFLSQIIKKTSRDLLNKRRIRHC